MTENKQVIVRNHIKLSLFSGEHVCGYSVLFSHRKLCAEIADLLWHNEGAQGKALVYYQSGGRVPEKHEVFKFENNLKVKDCVCFSQSLFSFLHSHFQLKD